MKIKILLSLMLSLFVFGCSSTEQKKDVVVDPNENMQIKEKGDQIATEPSIFVEKRLLSVSNGKPIEYEYVLNSEVIAKEILNENGEVISFTGEIPNGLVKQFDMENNLTAELNYNAGKIEGVTKTFYPNGKIETVKNYRNGKLEGVYREFYDDGQEKQLSNYKDGLLNGKVKKYSSSGTLLSSAEYINGELDGIYKEYYVTGITKIETEYFNGKKEGESKEYFPNGSVKTQYNFSQGKLEGDSKIYYEDGNINKIEKYKDGKLNGDTKIFSINNSEIPMYIDTYVNGKKTLRKAYSGKGELIFQMKY